MEAEYSGDTVVRQKKRTHTQARPPVISIDGPGRLRVGHLMALLAIGHTTFYERRAIGKIPGPDGDDGRPYWFTETIRPLLVKAGEKK